MKSHQSDFYLTGDQKRMRQKQGQNGHRIVCCRHNQIDNFLVLELTTAATADSLGLSNRGG